MANEAASGVTIGVDREPFGPAWDPVKYLWMRDHAGESGGGGFAVDFPRNRELALAKLREAEGDRWLDKQTRAVLCKFSLYNQVPRGAPCHSRRARHGRAWRVNESGCG